MIKENVFDKMDKLILGFNISKNQKKLSIIRGVVIDLNAKRELSSSQESELKELGLNQNEIEELKKLNSSKISALHRAAFAPSLFESKLRQFIKKTIKEMKHGQPDEIFSDLVHSIFDKFGRIKITPKNENEILDWVEKKYKRVSLTWLDNNWDDVVDYINAR